jgi:hypothetical protein
MSEQLNDIRLTISWKNVANFDTVERIKFVHRFNNQLIKSQIVQKPNEYIEEGSSFFKISGEPVSLYSDIPRETQYIGDHEVSVYFSFVKDLDLWLDLLGNIYVVSITEDDLTRNFDNEEGGAIILQPKLFDTPSYFLDDNAIEYVVRLRKDDTSILDKNIRLISTTIEGGFVMYHVDNTGPERVVEWMAYDDTGSILWVDNFNDAKTFYRVKGKALVPGTTERYEYDIMFLSSSTDIKSPTTRVLYKNPETQEVSFVQMKDIRTSFNDALIVFYDSKYPGNAMIPGSKEIEYTHTGKWTDVGNADYAACKDRCLYNSQCEGFSVRRDGSVTEWGPWTMSGRVERLVPKWACNVYLDDPGVSPKLKTTDIDEWKHTFTLL